MPTAFTHDPNMGVPSSTTNTGIATWSGTTGGTLLSSGVTIDSSNNMTVPGYLYLSGDEKELRFYEGANFVAIKTNSSLAGDYTLTLPLNDGGEDEFLQTNGSGVLTWAAAGGDFSNGGDNGALVLGTNDANSLTLETNNTARMVIANYGQITMPTQPAFCGYLPSNVTNVTGQAGTAWTMTGLTEDFDRGKAADNSAGNFNGSTFTAPVAGVYYFHSQAYMAGWAATSVIAPSVWLYKGSSAMFQGGTVDTAGDMVSSGRVRVDGMMLLAAGDTVTARVTATNASGGNIVDIQGGNNPRYTWFMGYLVA